MCVKNTSYNGCDNGVWLPTNYTTSKFAEWCHGPTSFPVNHLSFPFLFPLMGFSSLCNFVGSLLASQPFLLSHLTNFEIS